MKNIHINNDDNYATPPYFYEELNKRFQFDFDPCPYNEGEIEQDGLLVEWGNSNFVNPPYSRKLKEAFVKKGIEAIKPNATNIEFVEGRIKFGKLDNFGKFYLPLNKYGKTQAGTKDSMVVVFDGRKEL